MINEEPKTEQIDRYLEDEMMPAERIAFEERMRQDEELRLEIEAQKAVKGYLQQRGERLELRRLLEEFHTNLTSEAEEQEDKKQTPVPVVKPKWGNMSYLAIAASVALMIVSVWIIMKEPVKPTLEVRDNNRVKNDTTFTIPLLILTDKNGVQAIKETRYMKATLIKDPARPQHYRFTDTFELYLSAIPGRLPKININYDEGTKAHKVWIDGRSYTIRQTSVITPLR